MKRNVLFCISVYMFICARNAYAYLDPGTGSYMLQIVLGVLAAGFFAIKHYWMKIKQVFGSKPTEEELDD